MIINKLITFYKNEGLSDWGIFITKPSLKYRLPDFLYLIYVSILYGVMIQTTTLKEFKIGEWFVILTVSLYLIDAILSITMNKGIISSLFKLKKKKVKAYFKGLEIKTKKGKTEDWIYSYRENKLIEFFNNKKHRQCDSLKTDWIIDELRNRQNIALGLFSAISIAIIVLIDQSLKDFYYELFKINEIEEIGQEILKYKGEGKDLLLNKFAILKALFNIIMFFTRLLPFLTLIPVFKMINSPYKNLINLIIEMKSRKTLPLKD